MTPDDPIHQTTVDSESLEDFEQLLDRSSLGDRKAASTPDELVESIVDRAAKLEAARFVVGIEILPYRLVGTVVCGHGHRLAEAHLRLRVMHVDEVVAAADRMVGDLLTSLRLDDVAEGRVAIGLQIGGPVNTTTGTVLFYHKCPPADRAAGFDFTTWHNEPLGPNLQEATGLPVVVENDGTALAAYERWFGAGREVGTFAVMLVREGVGGAYVEDGRLSRAAAEIGQINARQFGRRCECGRVGCIEAAAGVTGILGEIGSLTGHHPSGLVEAVELAGAIDYDKQEKVLAAFRGGGSALAHAIGLMINMFGPVRLVLRLPPILADNQTRASRAYLTNLRNHTEYTHEAYSDCEVVVEPFRPYDGAHGAALIALDRHFAVPPRTALGCPGCRGGLS